MKKFDWAALVRLGLGQLRLTPDQFWQLTPTELALMAGLDGSKTLSRTGLGELMAKYPDTKE